MALSWLGNTAALMKRIWLSSREHLSLKNVEHSVADWAAVCIQQHNRIRLPSVNVNCSFKLLGCVCVRAAGASSVESIVLSIIR